MDAKELGRRSTAFQLGYWDAFMGLSEERAFETKHETGEYWVGYNYGLADFRSGR